MSEQAQGSSGPYERSEDVNSLDFKELMKDLQAQVDRSLGMVMEAPPEDPVSKPPAPKRAKNPDAQGSPNFDDALAKDKLSAKSALTRDGIEAGWNTKWKHWSSFSRLDFEVLIAIAMGSNRNKQLHERLRKRKGKNVPKSTISRHTTKLKKLGLITQKKIYNFRPFELTEKAKIAISIFLTRGAGEVEVVVCGHAFGFVCEILRKPRGLEERLKDGGWGEFYPKNRVGYKKELWGCTVVFNPRSVQFIPQEVYGASQDACFDVAYRLVLKVQDFLQKEYYGLVLGPITVIYNQQYAHMFDPLAVQFLKTSMKQHVNLTYRSDRLAIDQSKKVPELETIHKVFSKDDLRKICEFYEGLIRTDFKIEDIEGLKEAAKLQAMAGLYLAQNLKTHVDVLNEIRAAVVELRKAGTKVVSKVRQKSNGKLK